MEISLIMNQNSYVGREYLEALKKEDIKVDVLSIGLHPERDLIEEERCGKLWSPKDQVSLAKYHYFYNFPHLKSKQLNRFLIMKKYDLGIQGGTDIIKENIIDKYKLGILNFHPGLLPQYRGCSAPEWQIYENKNVYSTCHIIDKGIDTGKIVAKKQLNTNYKSYYHFRASIYKENDENDSDIYRGISYRKFNRKFTLADDIVVNDASLENGMLKIDLERIVPDAKKPRIIEVK